jgi:CCR4-NOT transcriptional regulation complex NOT5 subunit
MSSNTTFTQTTGLSTTTTSVAYENTPLTFEASKIAAITSVTVSKEQYRVFVSAEGARAGNLSTTSTQEAYRTINSVLTKKLSGL